MNDRAVSVLSEYEIEVIRTWKGRGAILFETPKGLGILKEYGGMTERLSLQNALLKHIRETSDLLVEEILPNREGMLWTRDQSQTAYVVKTYFEGKECSIRDMQECTRAMELLGRLHHALRFFPKQSLSLGEGEAPSDSALQGNRMAQEYEKHNRELKKVRRFLREKSQKNDFEIYLMKYYDSFMEQAIQVTESWQQEEERQRKRMASSEGMPILDRTAPSAGAGAPAKTAPEAQSVCWCHGEYQYHNLLFQGNDIAVINFEKCICDSQTRDLYLFLRKLLEKHNWSQSIGEELLEAYQREKSLSGEELSQLYYRLAYPEKFWKIVNFYYNNRKAWIPGRNMEKLDRLLRQEREKELFLKTLLK